MRAGLGIDIGGTGVKAAAVDLETGDLLSTRARVGTPDPSTPAAVAETVRQVVDRVLAEHSLPPAAPAGCGLPSVVKSGVVMTAANVDKGWIGVNAEELFSQLLGRQVHAINDADAAGLAEVHLGAGRGQHGTVLLLTLGTGIGSALFTHRRLVPNTELGHLEYRGFDAETELSGSARQRRRLSHEDWALEFNGFLARLEDYLWPDLIILGGGLSKSLDQFRHALVSRAPVVGARFRNAAGIIGAALAADQAGR